MGVPPDGSQQGGRACRRAGAPAALASAQASTACRADRSSARGWSGAVDRVRNHARHRRPPASRSSSSSPSILLFTALLSLPAATTSGSRRRSPTRSSPRSRRSASRACRTVDIATYFSPFGKCVIFIGVNIGGMGVLTLASILGLVISKRLGLRAKLIAASDTNPLRAHGGPVNEGQTVRLGEVGELLRTVALSTLVIEARRRDRCSSRADPRRHRPARRRSGRRRSTRRWRSPTPASRRTPAGSCRSPTTTSC